MTNVVMIITDNQGAWTLGCHGNEDIRTSHTDALAAAGMRFSNAYCVNSVCSPTRATYLTGLMPSQHGVHSYLGGEKPDAQMGPDAYCTIGEYANLPRLLADEGYTCGLSGKWHLGDSIQPQEGFSYWFTKPRGHTSRFYGDEAIWQGRVYEEPTYLTDAITQHALDFLDHHRRETFFLYVGYNGPYGLGEHMTSTHLNRHTEYYADKALPSFPRESIHPWLRANREFIGNPVSMRGYAAAVSGVDDGVGQILQSLERHGLDENTLVVFCADQGLCAGHHGMWGMGDHSRPLHTFEETLHIPLIFRHCGTVPAGGVFDGRTCTYDFFPSVLEYLGLEGHIPDRSRLPGRSYAPALTGRTPAADQAAWDDTIYYEFENTRMVRTGRWKYTWRHPQGPDELYDMEGDPGERLNLVGNPELGERVAELRHAIARFFGKYSDPQYDLWQTGRSKAGRVTGI